MKKKILAVTFLVCQPRIIWAEEPLYTPKPSEISFSQAAATGNTAKVLNLLSHKEIGGTTLGFALMSAGWAGHDTVCKEIVKQRGDDIDIDQLMKVMMRLINRHLERAFMLKPASEKDRIGTSDAAIIKAILDARGLDFDSADLRDAYQAAMSMSDSSRRPIVESLVALMKKRGIEWR